MIGAARTIQNTKRDRFYLLILMNQVMWWEEEAVSQAVLPYISFRSFLHGCTREVVYSEISYSKGNTRDGHLQVVLCVMKNVTRWKKFNF